MAFAKDKLAEYNRKRDFTRTAEPSGKAPATGGGNGAPDGDRLDIVKFAAGAGLFRRL